MRSKLCLSYEMGPELTRFKSTADSDAPYLYHKQHQDARGLFSQFSYLCHDELKSKHQGTLLQGFFLNVSPHL